MTDRNTHIHRKAAGHGHFFIILTALTLLHLTSAASSGDEAFRADPDPSRFEADINSFEKWDRKNSHPNNAVLFVGSSTILIWPTVDAFSGVPVVNRGFGGSHYSDVKYYFDRVVQKYGPRVIVLYAGDNDIAAGKSPQQVYEDFRELIEHAHERLPNTQIIVLAIKPSRTRWSLWPKMRETNGRIAQLARNDKQLFYVDTATSMIGADGQPRAELFLDDGLHMNEAGYQLWTEALTPLVQIAATAD